MITVVRKVLIINSGMEKNFVSTGREIESNHVENYARRVA